MSENTLSIEAQRLAVYAGICAVAARCDGAVTADGIGFNGQDTMYGRRVAAEPFESWTDEVHAECARIANTYQGQILAYTGTDVSVLPIVREAVGKATNRAARDDARSFERQRKVKAQRFVSFNRGRIEFVFPYDETIKDAIKSAGAAFDGQVWPKVWYTAPERLTAAHAEAVVRYGFRVEDAEADRWLEKALTVVPADPAERTHGFMVSDTVVFNFNGVSNWGEVKSALKEAGARFEPSDKTWRVALDNPAAAAVVAAARRVGLRVAVEVDTALVAAQGSLEVKLTKAELLLRASATSRPSELPAEFEALVLEKLGR